MADPIDLVVHVGSHLAHCAGLRRQLVAARRAVAAGGIFVPDLRDHPQPWRNLAWQLADDRRFDEQVSDWRSIIADARSTSARAVFVTSEEFETVLRGPQAAARLRGFADELGGTLRIVAVMRDHASYLNIVYATRAANLDTTRTFTEFVHDPEPAAQFSYVDTLAEPFVVADDARYLDVADVEAADGLTALLDASDVEVRGLELDPLVRDRVPGVLAVEVGLTVGRLLRGRDRPVTDVERGRANELRAELKNATRHPIGAYWGWTEPLLADLDERFAADAATFHKRTGATVPSRPDRPSRRPHIVDLHPSVLTALIDGAHTIASGTSTPCQPGGQAA